MHSKLFRLCSIVLAFVMLCNMLPMTTFAESINTSTTDNAVEPSNEEIQILGEDESLRSATQKHFRMSDGSFMAVDYGVPVHYLTDSGAWQEINNVPAMSAKANAYMAQNGEALTAYAANLSTGHVLTTAYGDVAVTMGLLDTVQAVSLTANDEVQLVTAGITFDRTATAQVDEIDGTENRYSTGTMVEGWTTEDRSLPDCGQRQSMRMCFPVLTCSILHSATISKSRSSLRKHRQAIAMTLCSLWKDLAQS